MSLETKDMPNGGVMFIYKYDISDEEPPVFKARIRNTFHYDNPDIPCVNCHMGNEDVNRNPTK